MNTSERRRHPRVAFAPMYTSIRARTLDSEEFVYEGCAYDISEGGLRFELDRPLEPGSTIAIQMTLPSTGANDSFIAQRTVWAFVNVVWLEDEDQPGPWKMAGVFASFARDRDLRTLRAHLARRIRQAA